MPSDTEHLNLNQKFHPQKETSNALKSFTDDHIDQDTALFMQESDGSKAHHKKLLERSTKNLDVMMANGYKNSLAKQQSRQDDAPPISMVVKPKPKSNVACSPIVMSPRAEKKDFCCQEVMTDPVLGINNFDSKGVTTETFGGGGTCEVKVVSGPVILTSESAC